jgi:hypothetical protein
VASKVRGHRLATQRLFLAGLAVANDVESDLAEVDRDLDGGIVHLREGRLGLAKVLD